MWTNLRSKRFRVNLLQTFAFIRFDVRKELTKRKCKTTAWAIIIFIAKHNLFQFFIALLGTQSSLEEHYNPPFINTETKRQNFRIRKHIHSYNLKIYNEN